MNQTALKGDTAPTLVVDLASAGNGVGADLVFSNIRLCNEDAKNDCQQILTTWTIIAEILIFTLPYAGV